MRRRELLLGTAAVGVLGVASACGSPNGSKQAPASGGPVSTVETYGSDSPLQVGEWSVPDKSGLLPTVMLVHGGFWRAEYNRSLENKVAADLVKLGYLVWNIDYRPSPAPWPSTLTDVAAGYDHLAIGRYSDRVDSSQIAVVGHSAGGQLVMWLASRHNLPSGAPGADPAMRPPALAVSQAGVNCLTIAAEDNLGGGAAVALCHGSPIQVPEHYAVADPLRLLPTGVKSVLIHGTDDDIVPLSQSTIYRDAAIGAGDHCTLEQVPGDHFVNIEPGTVAVKKLQDALAAMSHS